MPRYNWTEKRKKALDCLVRAGGNVRMAAELSNGQVSEPYIRTLKYSEGHASFRAQFYAITDRLLDEMEVDARFIISRLVKMADPDFPPPQRIQALKLLGDYRGIWMPEKREVSVEVIHRLEELGYGAEEVIAEVYEILEEGRRRSAVGAGG